MNTNKKTQESLINALAYCGLRDVPDIEDGENVWVKALAKVLKADGREYYVYVEKTDDGENRIVKDFGSIARIIKTLEYYPFSYLKGAYVPKFKTPKKDERIAYLKKYGVNKNLDDVTLKELDKLIINVGIQRQKMYEKEM